MTEPNAHNIEDCEECLGLDDLCTYHQGFVDGWMACAQRVETAIYA